MRVRIEWHMQNMPAFRICTDIYHVNFVMSHTLTKHADFRTVCIVTQLFMVSGGDDRRVLLWNVERALCDQQQDGTKYSPPSLKGEHHSNIFCLAFDSSNKKIFSGGRFMSVFKYIMHIHIDILIDTCQHMKTHNN